MLFKVTATDVPFSLTTGPLTVRYRYIWRNSWRTKPFKQVYIYLLPPDLSIKSTTATIIFTNTLHTFLELSSLGWISATGATLQIQWNAWKESCWSGHKIYKNCLFTYNVIGLLLKTKHHQAHKNKQQKTLNTGVKLPKRWVKRASSILYYSDTTCMMYCFF